MTKIAKIRINNILGIDELEISAGRFNQISGPNGSGKTSILEAIKAALRAGHDATLLRAGAEKGEAVLVLDDGTQIVKQVAADRSNTVVRGPDGKRVQRPGETVASLTDLLSTNPVDFLRATKKERVNVLLESLPIELDTERVAQITGKTDVPTGAHALVVLDAMRAEIFAERTGTNRAIKEKHATINQLSETLPDADPQIEDASSLLEQISEADRARDAELQRIATKLDGLRAESSAKIEELRRQIEAEQERMADIERRAAAQREITITQHRDQTASLREKLSTIQAAERMAAKHEATRETIAAMSEEASRLQAEADAQTAAIEALDAYKLELLANLPIPGLEVRDGDIYRHGVQFDRLNTAQQVEIAVEIAKLRAGRLGIMCVDGLELLDTDHFNEFERQAIESGLQLFVTRVADGEFSITTKE